MGTYKGICFRAALIEPNKLTAHIKILSKKHFLPAAGGLRVEVMFFTNKNTRARYPQTARPRCRLSNLYRWYKIRKTTPLSHRLQWGKKSPSVLAFFFPNKQGETTKNQHPKTHGLSNKNTRNLQTPGHFTTNGKLPRGIRFVFTRYQFFPIDLFRILQAITCQVWKLMDSLLLSQYPALTSDFLLSGQSWDFSATAPCV